MKSPRYQLHTDKLSTVFEFTSIGPRGRIPKLIKFTPMKEDGLFNLAFGDIDPVSGDITDTVVSNNGDTDKILLTAAAAVYEFTNRYANVYVFAVGSTHSRTRLYRKGITNNLDEILMDFEVYGTLGEEWEEFNKGIDYKAFLVKRKKV